MMDFNCFFCFVFFTKIAINDKKKPVIQRHTTLKKIPVNVQMNAHLFVSFKSSYMSKPLVESNRANPPQLLCRSHCLSEEPTPNRCTVSLLSKVSLSLHSKTWKKLLYCAECVILSRFSSKYCGESAPGDSTHDVCIYSWTNSMRSTNMTVRAPS